ncbi:hypothetical protein ES703_115640 [subsurface metagenome]
MKKILICCLIVLFTVGLLFAGGKKEEPTAVAPVMNIAVYAHEGTPDIDPSSSFTPSRVSSFVIKYFSVNHNSA